MLLVFKSLPNDKILDMTKLKAFADDELGLAKMTIYLYDGVENTVGKGGNAGNQYFLLFLKCFLLHHREKPLPVFSHFPTVFSTPS